MSTLYQISTSSALVEGVYCGSVSSSVLLEHGDFGLGTFEDLDGEMVVLDGVAYRVGPDGSVSEVGDDAATPFAVVTRFETGDTTAVGPIEDLAGLVGALDRLRPSDNLFFAVR